MFGSNKSEAKAPRSSSVETLVGRQTEIRGDIRFHGGLHIDGRVQGNVTAVSSAEQPAHLSISLSGSVEGNVEVPALVLNGSIIGDVYTSDKITLGGKARVTGDVHYKFIEMQGGAQINGKLVHASAEVPAAVVTPPVAEAPAPVTPPPVESPADGPIVAESAGGSANGQAVEHQYFYTPAQAQAELPAEPQPETQPEQPSEPRYPPQQY